MSKRGEGSSTEAAQDAVINAAFEVGKKNPEAGRKFLKTFLNFLRQDPQATERRGERTRDSRPNAHESQHEDYYSLQEVAEMTGFSVQTLRAMCRRKHDRLPHVEFNARKFGIPKSELIKDGHGNWRLKSQIDHAPRRSRRNKAEAGIKEKATSRKRVHRAELSRKTKIKRLARKAAESNPNHRGRVIPYRLLRKLGIKNVDDLLTQCWVETVVSPRYGEHKVLKTMGRKGKEIKVSGIGTHLIARLNDILGSIGERLPERAPGDILAADA